MRRLVGRDVLGAPRARGRPCRAHGDVRAARMGTFRGRGPPGTSPLPQTPRGRHAPVPPRRGAGMRRLVGRDVLGAPRAGGRPCRAHGDVHARMGTSMPRARGRSGDAGRRGRRPLPCDIKPTAWLFQKFPCIRRVPYRGNVQRESHPLSDILVFYRMSPASL